MTGLGAILGRIGLATVLAAFLLSACSVAPETPPGGAVAPQGKVAVPVADAERFAVNAARSQIRFLVRRAGTLARLGHNHVILARQLSGEIRLASDMRRSTVSLRLPVAGFEVDPAAERAALGAGFEPVPESAVIGTRRNMRGAKVLDAVHYPEVRIDTVAVAPRADRLRMTVRITLRGVARDLTVPVSLRREGDTLTAGADFTVRLSDFGITPLSVLGGALQVDDAVAMRMRVVAVSCDNPSLCGDGGGT